MSNPWIDGHAFVETEERTEFRPHPTGGHRWVSRCDVCGCVGYLYSVGKRPAQWRHKPLRPEYRKYAAEQWEKGKWA